MPKLPAKWRTLLMHIPGYNPFRDADEYTFSIEEAERALGFMDECVRHVEGAKAGELVEWKPWQRAVFANIFGWIDPQGFRRYREVLIFVPRKNGKTFMGAAIVSFVMTCDCDGRIRGYVCAADRDQATLCYDTVLGILEQDDYLSTLIKDYRSTKTIEFIETRSTFKSISATAETKHGTNTNICIIDEEHAQKSPELVRVMRTSMGARDEPLLMHITTSDYERPSICNETHDYASKVRDGIIKDAAFLPVIFEASKDEDWTSPKTWRSANPNLGVSFPISFLRRECQRAREEPSYENTFKRLHLNIRTEQLERWLQMEKWDACPTTLDAESLVGKACYAGLDLSSTQDLTALALAFPREGGFDALMYCWIPRDNAVARERKDRVPYTQWAREGWLEMTEGNVIDQDVIRRRVNEIGDKYKIQEVAIDRWNASQIVTQLVGDGFDVVPFGQGFGGISSGTKELERLVVSGNLATRGNPVLRWNASNVTIEMNAAGDIKPNKAKSTEKIDGIVALIMALGRAIVRDEMAGRSVYDERGVIVI